MTTTPYDWKTDGVRNVDPGTEQIYRRFAFAAIKQGEEPVEVMLRLLIDYADLHDPQPEPASDAVLRVLPNG